MNEKKILKLFIYFLKKEKVYKEYIEGLKNGACYRSNCSRIKKRDKLEWLVKTIKFCPQFLIEDAFSWNYSGWGSINEKWKDFFNKYG